MTGERTIIGIDPGTNILGFGVVRVDDRGPHYVDMGVFDLRKIRAPFEKLANIFAGIEEILATYSPDEMAVESPFYGKNAQVILKLGRAQGAAITAATMKGIPVTEYAPRQAKIAICGNGAASKSQVSVMPEDSQSGTGSEIPGCYGCPGFGPLSLLRDIQSSCKGRRKGR